MSKVKAKKLTELERIKTLDALYTASGSLKGRAAMKSFLRDLLTESERIMLGRRIIIARLILSGRSTRDIEKALGVGRDTIGKVARWLDDQFPGYEKAIRGLEREFKRREVGFENAQRFTSLKRKYPLHFLLFPWPKGHKPKGW